jgi:hypothetical protein
MTKHQQFVVTIVGTVEQGVSVSELKGFIEDAVSTWGGQFHPDEPLFSSMKVERVMAHRTGMRWIEDN